MHAKAQLHIGSLAGAVIWQEGEADGHIFKADYNLLNPWVYFMYNSATLAVGSLHSDYGFTRSVPMSELCSHRKFLALHIPGFMTSTKVLP